MPRLWKSEPEPTEDESPPAKKSTRSGRGPKPSRKSSDSKASTARGKTRAVKGKGVPATDENGEKKILIEETPRLDTYVERAAEPG